MQRGAWLFHLKEGMEEEYRKAHARVWPELIEAAGTAGLKNHSVFVEGSIVFAYAEAENLNKTMAELNSTEVTRRWNEAMARFMEDPEGMPLQEVFHFG